MELKATPGGKARIDFSGTLKPEANVKGYVGRKGYPGRKITDIKLIGELVYF